MSNGNQTRGRSSFSQEARSSFAQPVYEVNGLTLTQADVDRAMERGVTPQGSFFSNMLDAFTTDPVGAIGMLGRGIAGSVVEMGRDVAAIPEAAWVVTAGRGDRTDEELEELRKRSLRGAALLGSFAVGAGLARVAFAARPVFANLARGGLAGAFYGAVRPKEEGESIVDAVVLDAALFGGFGLAFDMIPLLRGRNPFTQPNEALGAFVSRNPQIAGRVGRMLASFSEYARGPRLKVRGGDPERLLQWRNWMKSPAVIEEAVEQTRALQISAPAEIAQATLERATGERLSRAIATAGGPSRVGAPALVARELRHAISDVEGAQFLGRLRVASKLATGEEATVKTVAAETVVRGDITQAGELFSASRGNATAFGRTTQEALDNLGSMTGATQGAALKQTLGYMDGVRRLGEVLGEGGGIIETGMLRPLGIIGRWLLPPHTWARVWPAFKMLYEQARSNRLIQEHAYADWRRLIDQTKKGLSKQERLQLGTLLNDVVDAGALPTNTSEKLAKYFGEWRELLGKNRKQLAALYGALPEEWGLDAYMMHVWVGDWGVKDARGAFLRLGPNVEVGGGVEASIFRSANEARAAAEQYLATHSSETVRIVPRHMVWDADASGVVIEPGRYIHFLSNAKDALSVSSIGKLALGGEKFFANALRREANLPGWLLDPVEAGEMYARGFARKVAYHNYADNAFAALRKARSDGVLTSEAYDAMSEWVNRVVGRPTTLERHWNAMVNWTLANPRVPTVAQRMAAGLRMRAVSADIRTLESWWRLGYSPLSAFVNLSQTWVNTASKVGYRDTGEGLDLLLKGSELTPKGLRNPEVARRIDDILERMGIRYAVPLSEMGSAGFQDIHRMAWWRPLYLFNKVETVNRGIAGLAGFSRSIRATGYTVDDFLRGAVPEEVLGRAAFEGRQLSDLVNFVYSIEDLPAIISGPAGQVLGQFKPFLIGELNFIAGLKGIERVRFAANLTAAGGVGAVMSLPLLNLADVVVGEVTGERFSEYAKRKFPHGARGIFGMLGFSAEQSIAINSIMAGRRLVGDPESNVFSEVIDMSLGPFARDAVAFANFSMSEGLRAATGQEPLSRMERSQLIRQLQFTQVRRIIDAYDVASKGQIVQPTTGRPLYAPDEPLKEAALTFLGFRSVEREEAERERNTISRISQQITRQRQFFVERILKAQDERDSEKVRELLLQAQHQQVVITASMLRNARDERRQDVFQQQLERIPAHRRYEIEQRVKSLVLPGTRIRRP